MLVWVWFFVCVCVCVCFTHSLLNGRVANFSQEPLGLRAFGLDSQHVCLYPTNARKQRGDVEGLVEVVRMLQAPSSWGCFGLAPTP